MSDLLCNRPAGRRIRREGCEFDDREVRAPHLQDAVPVRLGQEFGAYAMAVRHDGERISAAGERLRRMPIGGTATGTGLNAHPEYHARMVKRLSELSGLTLYGSPNLFESMQSLADVADFSREHAHTGGHADAHQQRFAAAGFRPNHRPGRDSLARCARRARRSSGKINPVLAEIMNMLCYHVMGNDLTVSLACAAGQLELNVMMPIVAHNLFQTMDLFIHGLDAFTDKCVKGITANREKAESWLAKSAVAGDRA